jgi:hypothetical protein
MPIVVCRIIFWRQRRNLKAILGRRSQVGDHPHGYVTRANRNSINFTLYLWRTWVTLLVYMSSGTVFVTAPMASLPSMERFRVGSFDAPMARDGRDIIIVEPARVADHRALRRPCEAALRFTDLSVDQRPQTDV